MRGGGGGQVAKVISPALFGFSLEEGYLHIGSNGMYQDFGSLSVLAKMSVQG